MRGLAGENFIELTKLPKELREDSKRIIRLNTFLLNEKRYDDLERASRDKDFRQQLIDQYGI